MDRPRRDWAADLGCADAWFVDGEHPRPALVAVESDLRPVLGGAVGSPQDRKHEMGDPVALDADRRVAEQDLF